MSLGNCIPGMVKRGEIDAQRGARMSALFTELETFYRGKMGPDAAAAEASEQTLKQLASEARLKKRQTLLQINRQREALKDLGRHRDGVSYSAVRAMLDDDAAGAPFGNVTRAAQVIEFDVHRRVSSFIERHRRNLLGQPSDKSGLLDVAREMHGQATGNVRAKAFADAINDANEWLRQRFNAAGGAVGKLENYFPHSWDALKVRNATADQWIDAVMPELDRARMIDNRTGVPFTDTALRQALLEVRETIRTNGLTGEASAAFAGGGKLANSRGEHRFLLFKDADAWLRVNEAFGAETTIFNTIMGHFTGLSQDIAQMERFGPNPDATVRLLLDHVAKTNAKAEGGYSADVAGRSGGKFATEQLWKYVKGESRTPIVPDSWLQGPPVWFSSGFDATRNVLTSAMLGSSPLSAISDINTQLLARKFNGLPRMSVLTGYLKQLNPASSADRQLAIRLGLGMRDASHAMLTIHRYMATGNGPQWSNVVADSVLRLSGLNKFTEAGQRAFGVEMLGTLGELRGKDFSDLPDAIRASLERNGIDRWAWTHIRQTPALDAGGAKYIDPSAIKDQRIADRLTGMVLSETSRAVQESSVSVRAAITANQRPGTWSHWLLSNTLQFKGFGIGLLVDQARRISTMGPYNAAAYGAQFFVGMTLFGALAIQLREIAKGRDPRPMDDQTFWMQAALQGGGLGIFGDVIGTFASDRVGSVGELFAGPTGSLLTDLARAGHAALPGKEREDGTRREANPGGAAVNLARRYVPGSNLWYLRAGWERIVMDQLDAELNTEHDRRIDQQLKRAEKNKQGFWWEPGQMEPTRAPNVANALGRE